MDLFQSQGGSMLMLAKGNRSQAVTDSCKAHGGFYLGEYRRFCGDSGSGICEEHRIFWNTLNWVWKQSGKMEVEGLPNAITVDDKGNNFFEQVQTKNVEKCVAGQPA